MSLQSRVEALATAVAADVKALYASVLSHAVEPYPFSYNGVVAVKTGTSKIVMENPCVVDTARAYATTAPVGATLIVDILKNGVSIYGNQANRPTIAAGANTALGGVASAGTFAVGDVLSVDVKQVGTTTPGSDLTVTVRMRRTT